VDQDSHYQVEQANDNRVNFKYLLHLCIEFLL